MKKLFEGIYEWSVFNEEKQYDFNGHWLTLGKESILIDPPPMTKEEEAQVKRHGSVNAIVITNVHHTREARKYRELFGAKVYVPQKDRQGLDLVPDFMFDGGDMLFGQLQAVSVPNNKSPGETALYLKEQDGGLWILGDALIGKPAGNLNLMSPDKYKDIAKAKEGVKVLLKYPFQAVLVGDGKSILWNAGIPLTRFLKGPFPPS